MRPFSRDARTNGVTGQTRKRVRTFLKPAVRIAWFRLAFGFSFAACFGGCRSVEPTLPSNTDPPAEALAAFSLALQRDWAGDQTGALAQYKTAMEADPAHATPYWRALAVHGELRRAGKESHLLAFFESLAARHPDKVEPLKWIARLHAADDRPEEAIRAYARALHVFPGEDELYAEQLEQRLKVNGPDELLAAFRNVLNRNIDPSALATPAGKWLLLAMQEDAATEVVQEILSLLDRIQEDAAEKPETLLILGEVYRRADQPARAAKAYAQARRLAPTLPDTYLRQALLHLSEKDFKAAEDILSEGIEAVDQPIDLLRLLAYVTSQQATLFHAAGNKAAEKEALEKAIAVIRRLLDILPTEPQLRLHLGDLLLLSGQEKEAIREVSRIRHPNASVQQDMVRRFLAAGDDDDALDLARTLAGEHPQDAGILLLLGKLLHRVGNTAEANQVLKKAGQVDTPPPAVFLSRALWLAEANQYGQAVKAVEEGLAAIGETPLLLELGAILLIETNRPQEALTWFARLQKLESAAPSARLPVYRALALQYAGKPEQAALLLAKLFENDRALVELFFQFAGRLDARFDNPDPTRATLQHLADKRADDPLLSLLSGLYEYNTGEYARAVSHFSSIHAKAERDPAVHALLTADFFFQYGAAAERAGVDERSMALLEKAVRLDPDHADALNYLAYMWAERAINLDRAHAYIRRALKQAPGSAPYIDTLGWIYFQQGQYEKALSELQRARAGLPNDPTLADHLGDTLAALGRVQEAIEHWRRALENDPENPEAIRTKLRKHGAEPEIPPAGEPISDEPTPAEEKSSGAKTTEP